jgi:hypothetical protein
LLDWLRQGFYVRILAKASCHDGSIVTEAQIAKLTSCYAQGTDAIGRLDLQGGKDIYAPCFAADAEFEVYFPGTPWNGPPSFETVGTESWADFVCRFLRPMVSSPLIYLLTPEIVGRHRSKYCSIPRSVVLAFGRSRR